ncbi:MULTISPECIES: DUF1269 domain-containing protein [unclassified Haematobacter]|uniref:DUF1269 domain-containing protein n=1 Tax=unclassified Haematobacter TaxID=2640585 RepID=UPI0025BF3CFA|nr:MULTISPECIES: DUF1269 domain-containing protein [unclassified Haematobacter]
MTRNIVLVTWLDDSKPYEALTKLKGEDPDRINQAAVVYRESDGRVTLRDGGTNIGGEGTLGGGALGALIGILGGPLGVLLGFSTGALFGSLVDTGNEIDDDSVLSAISAALPPGKTGILVDIEESTPEILDNLAVTTGGVLVRYNYEATLSEIMSAESAAEAASDEAARVLREEKKADRKAEREEKWEKTKEKFKSVFHKSDKSETK